MSHSNKETTNMRSSEFYVLILILRLSLVPMDRQSVPLCLCHVTEWPKQGGLGAFVTVTGLDCKEQDFERETSEEQYWRVLTAEFLNA